MIASLGMYDRDETKDANDRFWALIRDGMLSVGLPAPESLTRGAEAYWPAWRAPDLILSQTCGLPYRSRLHDTVTLIGTPDYGVAGCAPGYYRSVFVARLKDPRTDWTEFDGATLAFNEELSQSGWAAPQTHAASHGITLRPLVQSGGHALSARAVAEGRAEIAAIDAVTWTLLTRSADFTKALKVVGQTDPTPGLPYIAARDTDAAKLFAIISAAIAALSPTDRDTLCLRGLVRIEPETYLGVATPPSPQELGFLRQD